MNNEIKLHLGCGKRYLPGYLHIDINNLPHMDYCTEIHNLSIFEDNSVSEIYNCGVIGYYDREETSTLLRPFIDKFSKKDVVYKKTAYDFKSLKRVLENNGFGDYKRYEWQNFLPENYDDYSAAYVPHRNTNGVHIMLNVECKKC
mgnify:CR=1 FL=1